MYGNPLTAMIKFMTIMVIIVSMPMVFREVLSLAATMDKTATSQQAQVKAKDQGQAKSAKETKTVTLKDLTAPKEQAGKNTVTPKSAQLWTSSDEGKTWNPLGSSEATAPAATAATGRSSAKHGHGEALGVGAAVGIGGLGASYGGYRVVVAAKRRKRNAATVLHGHLGEDKSGETLKSRLDALTRFMDYDLGSEDKKFKGQVRSMIQAFHTLFTRLDATATAQQKRMAWVDCTNVLSKLETLLSKDYYIDIRDHGNLWNKPEEKLLNVREAVAAAEAMAIENVRLLNDQKELDFSTAVDSIISLTSHQESDKLYENLGKKSN